MIWQKGIIISIKPSYIFKPHVTSSALKAESATFWNFLVRDQQLSQPHARQNKTGNKNYVQRDYAKTSNIPFW